MSETVSVDEMRPNEADAVAHLYATEIWGAEPRTDGYDTWFTTEHREVTGFGEHVTVVVRHPETDAVIAAGTVYTDRAPARIPSLAVHSDHRRERLGSAVLTELEQRALSAGSYVIGLLPATDAAEAFFIRHGYAPKGDQESMRKRIAPPEAD